MCLVNLPINRYRRQDRSDNRAFANMIGIFLLLQIVKIFGHNSVSIIIQSLTRVRRKKRDTAVGTSKGAYICVTQCPKCLVTSAEPVGVVVVTIMRKSLEYLSINSLTRGMAASVSPTETA